jgi:hypothetical protein
MVSFEADIMLPDSVTAKPAGLIRTPSTSLNPSSSSSPPGPIDLFTNPATQPIVTDSPH